MRKGCRASKSEKKCVNYSYSLLRCVLGRVPATCSNVIQPQVGKAASDAQEVRDFYASFHNTSTGREEGVVSLEELYRY